MGDGEAEVRSSDPDVFRRQSYHHLGAKAGDVPDYIILEMAAQRGSFSTLHQLSSVGVLLAGIEHLSGMLELER